MDLIITGQSKGLGRAIYTLALDVQSISGILTIGRDAVVPLPGNVHVQADLADRKQLDAVCTEVEAWILFQQNEPGELVFINNAASIYPIDRVGGMSTFDVCDHITVNAIAPVVLTNALLKARKKRPSLQVVIINLTSEAANRAIEGWSLYSSSKLLAKHFFDVIKVENDAENIKIIQFDPGKMDTDMQAYIREQDPSIFPDVDIFKDAATLGRLASPELVAKNLLDLAFSEVLSSN